LGKISTRLREGQQMYNTYNTQKQHGGKKNPRLLLAEQCKGSGAHHLNPPTTKTSEYCFFPLKRVKLSIVHVNRDVCGSSAGWLSAVLATSVCATTANSHQT
jgi:hypothetical protein